MRSRCPALWSCLAPGLALLAFAAGSRPAAAYPLNPWGAHTATGYVAVNPFLYLYSGPSIYPIVYVEAGLTDHWDIIGGLAGYANLYSPGGGGGLDYLEVFPRYFFNDNMGVTLHIIYGLPGSASYADTLQVGPELHAVFGGDTMALTLNAGWSPAFEFGSESSFNVGSVFIKAAPEYNISKQFSVYLEVDPSLELGSTLSPGLILVPGVGFATDKDQTNTFSVGLQVDTMDGNGFGADNLSVGVWWARGWGGS